MGLLTVATKIHFAIVVCKFPQDMEKLTMSCVGNVCEAGYGAFLTCLPVSYSLSNEFADTASVG